jgi:hypothetical protein
MKRYLIRLAISSAWLILAATPPPAHATSEYTYKKNEYRIIRSGRAPNRQLSITAHGEGEGGYKNFHLYLTVEPTHAPIARLDGVGPDDVLDTGPNAITAVWSPDSRHVAVFHRSDRHIVEMRLYGIQNRHAQLMSGPTLFNAAMKSDKETEWANDTRTRVSDLVWLGPTRFKLTEDRVFHTSAPELARTLGAFGKQTPDGEKTLDSDNNPLDWYFLDFSAEAVCELVAVNKYRILELKPGQFGRSDKN